MHSYLNDPAVMVMVVCSRKTANGDSKSDIYAHLRYRPSLHAELAVVFRRYTKTEPLFLPRLRRKAEAMGGT